MNNIIIYIWKACRRMTIVSIVAVLVSGLSFSYGFDVMAASRMSSMISLSEIDDAERLDVSVKGMYVYITTNHQMTIRLYSILGQLIVQQVVSQGTTRVKAPGRGIYILQAGSITRRVTIN